MTRKFLNWQRKRDFLRELQSIVWIGLAGLLLLVVFQTVDVLSGGPISTVLAVKPGDVLSPGLSRPGLTVDSLTEVTAQLDNPTPRQRVLSGLTRVPSALLLLAVLAVLARVVYHARKTEPFTKRTVNGLRWMGLAFFAGILAAPVEAWARYSLSDSVFGERSVARMEVPIAWLFAGFLCFAVAEVVQRGVLMREELEAVV